MRKIVVATEKEVIDCLAGEIEQCAKRAIAERAVFRVGVSGGSVLNYISCAIPRIDTDLTKWRFFFCDERYVDETNGDSTFGAYKTTLLPTTILKAEQFAAIDTGLPLEDCARDYEVQIRAEFQAPAGVVPSFDLLLLGMGPDGHTCSLFPEHKLLLEEEQLIAAIADSPKPPPQRVTMTLPLINNARACIFAMCGAGKADMVKRVFVDKEDLPAGKVNPKCGELVCILDEAAGKYLK